MFKYILALVLFVAGAPLLGHEDAEDVKVEQVKEGNFSLPTSQQPGPFISFGQNIIDKGQRQASVIAQDFQGGDAYQIVITPSILYAVTDEFSLFLNVPFAPSNKDWHGYSHGLKDVFIQGEYAYYNRNTDTELNQATIVAALAFPTGSVKVDPPTGFGAASCFVGLTFAHTDVEWFYFASPGVNLVTKHHSTRFGNQYVYQAGIGKNMYASSDWIINWLVEVDGQYSRKNKIKGVTDPNSGGNVVYLTPSLWVSSERLILQVGVGWPVVQNLFGSQPKFDYTVDVNLSWTF